MKINQHVFALASPLIVTVVQYFFWEFIDPFTWFLFLTAVFFSAQLGGLRCAMISAMLSVISVWFLFLQPGFSWQLHQLNHFYVIALFLLMSYLIGKSQEKLNKAQDSLNGLLHASIDRGQEILNLYEKNLALDQIKFSQLANSLPQIVWVTNADGSNIFFNQSWYAYTGMTSEESAGDGWSKPFHPDDQPLAWHAWQNAVTKGVDYSLECRIRRADGEYRWWLIRGAPSFNLNNEIDKWFGTCTDIHDLKQALEDIQLEKKKLQSVFENSPDGIAIIRPDESFSAYNDKYFEYFQLNGESKIERSYSELLALFEVSTLRGDAVPQSNFPGIMAIKGEPVFSQELHFKNRTTGREWYGSHSSMPIRDADGAITGAILSVRDITLNVRDKLSLISAVREQEAILNSGIVGIAKLKDRKLIWFNRRFADNFGYSEDELLGQSSEILYPSVEAFNSFGDTIQDVHLQGSALLKETIQLKRKDGSLGWYLVGGGSLEGGSDESIWMSIDVTADRGNQDLLVSYAARLKRSMEETLLVLSRTIEMRDPYTAGHQQRVGILAEEIGKKLQMSPLQTHNLNLIGLIHDIGKIGIPAEILTKPTKLSQVEYDLVKTHVNIGYDILKGVNFLIPIADVVHEHHERFDGTGYPMAMKGDQILLEARIIAVADVIESMSARRPYRAALGIDKALQEVERGRGTAYDPAVVDACLELFRKDGYQLPEDTH
jgi:PAS domain S-box-containing protein